MRGSSWVILEDETPLRFATGDVGLLSAPLSFVLTSHSGVDPVDAMTLFSGVGRTTTQTGDGCFLLADDVENLLSTAS
ncbi:hypothetical protein BAE42_30550 [Mesorhizobium loti]|uniref:hypothetical protein n=1 Tax=Mesorhizobium TaxID=68287 RepID=UPI0007EDF187|nr:MULTISPECIES: hypothetical protein [Mesorhizobium]OBP77756.1 hypothetical protein BAE42_30550 [Mesorhizobium loti]OBQ63779.1 hypothetical protein A8146_30960 [Mesorhizobium loti]